MDVRSIAYATLWLHLRLSLKSDAFAMKSYRNEPVFFAMVVYLSLSGVDFNRMQYF
jgi:hypothetical protein